MSNAVFQNLSRDQLSKIAAITKKTGRISSSEFNKIISNGETKTYLKKNNFPEFAFICDITSPSEGEIRVLFKGRHYSKNDINSFSIRKKLAYKSAIKKAFADGAIIGRKAFPKTPFELVRIEIISTLKRSRDDDSQQETTKIMRDCCTTYGIIKDDNRKVVLRTEYIEKIAAEYSIELIIRKAEADNSFSNLARG